ncbi:hypothetical protein NEUTE2DRAFT_49310 [Neurospora tetrasperma FGSC 2509]|nr:hypothetical protein NEUTE2DRAFT_49310 [Neurospora tetrasperma FGSC 2509]
MNTDPAVFPFSNIMLCKLSCIHFPISERVAESAEPQTPGAWNGSADRRRGTKREDDMKQLSGELGFVEGQVPSCVKEVMFVDLEIHTSRYGSPDMV